jgi:hypothetical protein
MSCCNGQSPNKYGTLATVNDILGCCVMSLLDSVVCLPVILQGFIYVTMIEVYVNK